MNPGTRISNEAAIEAAALAMRSPDLLTPWLMQGVHRDASLDLAIARAVLDTALPLVEARLREELANQIETAAAAHTPSSSYREGLIDGHHRVARVVRGNQEATA